MQTVVLNRPAMARGYGVFLLCVFAALGSGCSPIGFERQHLGLVLDEQKDEARAILVYENLHVSGSSESDLTRAKDLTAEIFRDRYTFCLGYPILQVSLANREQRPLTLEEERTLNLLRSHITIPEASLYLNKDGALCGVQKIRVTKLGEFVEFLNGQISQGFVEFTEKALVDKKMRGDRWDVGTLRLVQKAAKSDFQWLRTTEGRLSFSLPGTPEFFRKYRREILPDLLGVKSVRERLPAFSSSNSANRRIALVDLCNSGSLEKSIKDLELLTAFLNETDVSIDQRHDQITFTLGLGGGEPIRLSVPSEKPEPSKLQGRFIDHGKSLFPAMEKGVDSEKLMEGFLQKPAVPGRRP